MAPPEDDRKSRVGRKLTKKIPHGHRIPSPHIPERFRYGEDAQDDVTAPAKGPHGNAQYMNQSVFSMIAAAGSRTDFHARFDESSDSEDETRPNIEHTDGRPVQESTTAVKQKVLKDAAEVSDSAKKENDKHKRKQSEDKRLRSLTRLSLKNKMSKTSPQKSGTPFDDGSSKGPDSMSARNAPMLSRMLTAQAKCEADALTTEVPPKSIDAEKARTRADSSPATLLATRLMEIFNFDTPEKVVSEYPCWLLQSVLLQGYMYITQKHICFYAYLPKKSNVVAKTGHLSKRGRQNPKYHRYWFTLKGDVLSYYSNPSDLYFPHGNIDLRYGISASLLGEKDTKDFSVTTDHRTYHFRADSAPSAREWVKTLQKVIFRSHNDGDSVKISLPIENVIDIEESPVVEFAETLKLRVVESGDSYAIDEYFFSFFSFGKDVLSVLNSLTSYTPAQRVSHDIPQTLLSPTSGTDRDSSSRAPSPRYRGVFDTSPLNTGGDSAKILRDSVKATLTPYVGVEGGKPSPRMSGEFIRSSRDTSRSSMDLTRKEYGRSSFDAGRRSGSTSRLNKSKPQPVEESPPGKQQGSSGSFVQSLDKETGSSTAFQSATTDAPASGSQILSRSDVFQTPTINRLIASPSQSKEDLGRQSEDTARSNSAPAEVLAELSSHVPAGLGLPNPQSRHASFQASPGRSDNEDERIVPRTHSSPNLQDIVRAGSYPLQRAAGFAGYLKSRSTRMSKLLATESMGYIEKVSGMWQGGRKHYGENEGILPENRLVDPDPEDEEENSGHGDRFRAHFALPASEKLQATYFAYFHRVLPLYGKIYISNRNFCFRSLLPGTKTKVVLPLKDIENVDKEKGFRFGYHGLVLVIRGHEELFFEFNTADLRDDCSITLLQNLESIKYLVESGLLAQSDKEEAEMAKAENEMLQEARKDPYGNQDLLLHRSTDVVSSSKESPPVLFDDPRASIVNFKPTESLRVTCLTIGSRGDVQPYIALCKGLIAEGHKPKIATHREFEPWVRKHGIDFAPVEGDPAELMRICVENGMFTYSFLKEASLKFRSWIDDLLSSAWNACQDTDLLIESPSAMAGIHIAEALRVPYFRAFTMPWTRTRAYPHAFAVPEHKIGGAYNYFSYVMFDNVFWKAIAGQVNRWRKKELGLRSTNLDKMQPNKVPFLYNFSPHVVVPPLDYSDWVRVTGYWFLDEAKGWTPSEELTAFIAKARIDGKKLVYIGFGSIVVSDPAALTKTVVDSVLKADVRCILSKGWSDRLGDPTAVKTEVPLPPEIHQIKSAPHDWLFRQMDAAVHHGGAGTTGASLRAGIPTVIKPFFGDQFFFGSRVEDLGVGICLKKINVSVFSRALWEAVHSERMIVKAKALGEQIRQERGVEVAIQAIYRDLEYAKSLIKVNHDLSIPNNSTNEPAIADDDFTGDIEESWTFIGDESDPELKRRIASWDGTRAPRVSMDRGLKAVQGVEPVVSKRAKR